MADNKWIRWEREHQARIVDVGPRWKSPWHRVGVAGVTRRLSAVAVGAVSRQLWVERLVGRLLNRALRWLQKSGQSIDRAEVDVNRWRASIVVDHATGNVFIPLGGADTIEEAKKLVDDYDQLNQTTRSNLGI